MGSRPHGFTPRGSRRGRSGTGRSRAAGPATAPPRSRTAPTRWRRAGARSTASVVRVVSSHSAASSRNGMKPSALQRQTAARTRARSPGAELRNAAPNATPVRIEISSSRRSGRTRPKPIVHSPPTARFAITATTNAERRHDHARARGRRRPWRPSRASACGTSVNVISAVRCDHSELTSRMPTIGSRMLAGVIASANRSRKISSSVVGEDADERRRPRA